jgi:glucosyl-3-phosphoglycerate synthase
MPDIYQDGLITTLHRFGSSNLNNLEEEIYQFSKRRPIALVLPAVPQDIKEEGLRRILKELRRVRYLRQIVVTLGQTDRKAFRKAKDMFRDFPIDSKLIWNTGARIQKLYRLLENNGISAGADGKGRSAWMAYGYILALGECEIIALHDCDILTYSRELLHRLCYPLTNPVMDYKFCKGYYSRVTDRLHGRVTRLFVFPLIKSLKRLIGQPPFLRYLESFRYPLSGEFSIVADLTRINRVPGDWGLDIGLLAGVYRRSSLNRICQVDLLENYEHRHRPLSADSPTTGMFKMSIDITRTLLRILSNEGIIFPKSFFNSLNCTYIKVAEDTIKKYEDDANINGLFYDRHEEKLAVETFMKALGIGIQDFLDDPLGVPPIPDWNRAISAVPNFFGLLIDAVEKDNQ